MENNITGFDNIGRHLKLVEVGIPNTLDLTKEQLDELATRLARLAFHVEHARRELETQTQVDNDEKPETRLHIKYN